MDKKLNKSKKKIDISESTLFNQKFDIVNIIEEVDEKGHSEIYKLNDQQIEKIKDEVYRSRDFDLSKLKDPTSNLIKISNESEENYFKRLSKTGISRLTGTVDLKKDSGLKEIALSKPLLEIASSYLNTNKLSINANFFISNPIEISEQEKYINAQYFHWDNDLTKYMKLYIYLTDVFEGSGPHIYIPYTHKKKLPEHKLCRLYSDQNIIKNYKNKKVFYGEKGSFFL